MLAVEPLEGSVMAGIAGAATSIWRSPWSRRLGSALLFAWFAYWTWQVLGDNFSQWPYHLDVVGTDGRLYYRAAQTWLAGGDPWTAYVTQNAFPLSGTWVHFLFTGPPPTVLAFVPFAWIPEPVFVIAWLGATVAAALYTLRRLHLPVWWILFPPLAQGIFVANPHVVCLALLLSGSKWLQALAVPMKAYAVIPMVGERQWRALVLLAVGVAATVILFWPLWTQYAADYSSIQEWIVGATHGGFSATRDPRLLVLALAAIGLLALMDRRSAGWLAVPAVWPATQYFYATFALPLRSPWLAAALAIGVHRADAGVPWAIIAYVVIRLVVRVLGYARPAGADEAYRSRAGNARGQASGRRPRAGGAVSAGARERPRRPQPRRSQPTQSRSGRT